MATAAKTAVLLKPTKGVRPHTEGVPGELLSITEIPADLDFSARRLKISPYDVLLKSLMEAGPDKMLMFGAIRARASVMVRSRKLGIKIETGEHAGKLYVRLAPGSTAPPPATKLRSVTEIAADDHKTRNRAAILSGIRAGNRTPEAIGAWLRKQEGLPQLDGPVVRSLLKHMQTAGVVVLERITPETWQVAEGMS